MTVTSFPTHTQRKKLKFSETALSFAVKVRLSTFVCILLVKLWRELRTRRAFDRCEDCDSYMCRSPFKTSPLCTFCTQFNVAVTTLSTVWICRLAFSPALFRQSSFRLQILKARTRVTEKIRTSAYARIQAKLLRSHLNFDTC